MHVVGLGLRRRRRAQLAAGSVRSARAGRRVGEGQLGADRVELHAQGTGRAGRWRVSIQRAMELLERRRSRRLALPRRNRVDEKRRARLSHLPRPALRHFDQRQLAHGRPQGDRQQGSSHRRRVRARVSDPSRDRRLRRHQSRLERQSAPRCIGCHSDRFSCAQFRRRRSAHCKERSPRFATMDRSA